MKPLECWTCQRADNLKKKSSKIPKNNYAATMVSAARRQNIGDGGTPPNKNKPRRRADKLSATAARRSTKVGAGGAHKMLAAAAHGSRWTVINAKFNKTFISYCPSYPVTGVRWTSSTSRNMKPLERWTYQRAEKLKKKSSKIPKNNYAATLVSAARRQNIGGC